MKPTITFILIAAAAFAQTSPGAAQIRITGQTLLHSTTAAMFGPLPKSVTAVSVQACSQVAGSVSLPTARIVQQLKLAAGITVLPRDAAIVVVSQAQGRGKVATVLRYLGSGTGTVSALATLKIINVSSGWGAGLILWTAAATVAGQEFGAAAQTHTLLAVSAEALPDPIALAPFGCASGIALVESPKGVSGAIDFLLTVPGAAQ